MRICMMHANLSKTDFVFTFGIRAIDLILRFKYGFCCQRIGPCNIFIKFVHPHFSRKFPIHLYFDWLMEKFGDSSQIVFNTNLTHSIFIHFNFNSDFKIQSSKIEFHWNSPKNLNERTSTATTRFPCTILLSSTKKKIHAYNKKE